MRQPFSWLKRLLGVGDQSRDVLQIFTPQAASLRSTGTRLALAAATVTGILVAGSVAISSLLMLLLAMGALYYLLTQVLGVRLDVDPRAFVEQAQRYAQYSRN
jgi:hypothetical protein